MKLSFKKMIAGLITIIVLLGIGILAIYLKSLADYKRAVNEISIENIHIADVSDGIYIGACDVDFIRAKVEVTIHNGEITEIKILEHKNERGQAAEAVISKIISEQKIDVDAVSGATNSSTVLKKAVENALKTDSD